MTNDKRNTDNTQKHDYESTANERDAKEAEAKTVRDKSDDDEQAAYAKAQHERGHLGK